MSPVRSVTHVSGPDPLLSGGGGGIRTPETLSSLTVFKTAGFNHSPTPPRWHQTSQRNIAASATCAVRDIASSSSDRLYISSDRPLSTLGLRSSPRRLQVIHSLDV